MNSIKKIQYFTIFFILIILFTHSVGASNFWIRDEDNRAVILHGLNISNAAKRTENQISWHTFEDYKKVYPATTKEDFIAHLGEPEEFIIFKPGEKFFYNNDMFTCLGFIIEKISGITYPQFIKKEILDPLEMKRAVFLKEDFENDPLDDKITCYFII